MAWCLWLAQPANAVFPDPVTRGGLADEDAAEAEKLIDQKRFEMALPLLRSAVARHPDNVDIHNALGLALRKLGRLDESHDHYARALALDSDHKEAHEYMGELFLMRGEPKRALEMLGGLRRLCPAGCEERAELDAALAAAGIRPD